MFSYKDFLERIVNSDVYLENPILEPVSNSYNGVHLQCGCTRVQGWRLMQEDMINCIVNFRGNSDEALFGVYDGHGGPEISIYVQKHLPEKLIEQLAIHGEYSAALHETFLALDEDLKETDTKLELSKILDTYASEHDYDAYALTMIHVRSEYLKSKYEKNENKAGTSNVLDMTTTLKNHEASSDNEASQVLKNGEAVGVQDLSSEARAAHPPGSSGFLPVVSTEQKISHDQSSPSLSGSVPMINDGSDLTSSNHPSSSRFVPSFSDESDQPGSSSFVADSDQSSTDDDSMTYSDEEAPGGLEQLMKMAADDAELMESDPDDDDYSPGDESEDEDFKTDEETGTIHDLEAAVNSGSTATVAVIKGKMLYVASAGDSRCVICRKGTAVDLSTDHKPEDSTELSRIVLAGGNVTEDGRINEGLNLSRAIGDFAYKSNEKLPPEDQMVICVPGIEVSEIRPEDEFMVLACDGLWNSMSSQEVVDYIKIRLESGEVELSSICEELCYHIIPGDSSGDGTGLDNISIIIVRFKYEDTIRGGNEEAKTVKGPNPSETAP